jgi:hypothetical protein
MFLFILLSLVFSFLAENDLSRLALLVNDEVMMGGVVLVVMAGLLAALNRLSCHVRYDLFASGTLLIWLPYWFLDFREGSPVFFFLPLYFALLSAFCWLVFVKKREDIDQQTLEFMQWLSDSGRFNPFIIAVVVLVGLYFKQHFLLYPSAITIWVLRYALASSIEDSE